VGIYPNETANLPEDYIEQLRTMAKNSSKVVAIGEIGMDYGFEGHPDPAIQEKCFREQLELAIELDLPVVIHDRDADEDTLRIIKDYNIRGEIHRIFSPVEYANAFM
jgi:TatD DNase family protein